jgi:hypothetical protein
LKGTTCVPSANNIPLCVAVPSLYNITLKFIRVLANVMKPKSHKKRSKKRLKSKKLKKTKKNSLNKKVNSLERLKGKEYNNLENLKKAQVVDLTNVECSIIKIYKLS